MNKIAFDASDLDTLINVTAPNLQGDTIGQIVTDVVSNYVIPIAGFVLLIYLVIGGYQLMMSGGNPKSIEAGRSKIVNAVIGFILVFAAYWIVQIVATALGLRTILNIFPR